MHATNIYIACEQFIRHQTVKRTQARSEDFHTRVVCALLHTCVFMKFKSSCIVASYLIQLSNVNGNFTLNLKCGHTKSLCMVNLASD